MTLADAQRSVGDEARPLLSVAEIEVAFRTRAGALHAVRNATFDLNKGQTLCVVGESGSGKSTLSMAIAGLLPVNAVVSGEVWFEGLDLLRQTEAQLAEIRGRRMGVVFQDPSRSLNPVFTIGRQIGETLQRHLGLTRRQALARAAELLAEVGVNDPNLRITQYPHELSGGLKQRVMIAIAIACEPALLIADEPTTALDVTIQGQVLRLLQKLSDTRGLALILVTHDFGVVAAIADRVAVMYAGRFVEYAEVVELFRHPLHPYTRALLEANPRKALDAEGEAGVLAPIPGSPPNPLDLPVGCSFAPRCSRRFDACNAPPALAVYRADHAAACWTLSHD